MLRRWSFLLFALMTILSVSAWPILAQTPADPTGGGAQVDLPRAPVAATPEPEPTPAPVPATPAPVAATPLFDAAADTLIVLVDYRTETEIRRDIDMAVAEKGLAEHRVERARLLAKLAESRIEIKKSEIKALEAEINYAKTQKNEVKRLDLETRKKFAEREKQLLEKRRDLREREIETARAVREYHEATEKANRLEMQLAIGRRERAPLSASSDPNAAAAYGRQWADLAKLEGQVLEAQVQQADKRKDLADQEVKLGKIRRVVYESQLKVAGGGR